MIRPRKEETESVVQLLEAGEFETPQALAAEIIREVYRQFQARDWEIWVHRNAGMGLLIHGPFTGDREAEKLASEAALGGENTVYKMHGPALIRSNLESIGLDTAKRCSCGHLKGLHEHGKKMACQAGRYVNRKWVRDCTCSQFQ